MKIGHVIIKINWVNKYNNSLKNLITLMPRKEVPSYSYLDELRIAKLKIF